MDAISLAKGLIACPSVTPLEGGALDYLESVLEPLGFVCTRYRFEDVDTPPVENLYARYGTAAPNICFAGHTDVVPPGDVSAWTYDPFTPTIDGEYLYGRGTEDMKAAIAAFAAAAARVIEAGQVYGSISFLITGDEEGPAINGTKKLLAAIADKGETIDACIVGEPTNPEHLGEMIKIGRRGSLGCELTVHGKQGHVAYPHLANNPTAPMVTILHELVSRKLDDGTEFFPASNLEITTIDVGNPASNVIPGEAYAYFNIRFNTEQTAEGLEAWIRSVCDAAGCDYTLNARCSAEPFLTEPGPLSSMLSAAVEEVTGRTPALTTTGGTSDARFIKDVCPVVEFGTTGLRAHMVDERVRVKDVEMLSAAYQRFLEAYFKS